MQGAGFEAHHRVDKKECTRMKLGLVRISTMAAMALLAAGCASNRAHKGAVIDPELFSSVQPGVDILVVRRAIALGKNDSIEWSEFVAAVKVDKCRRH